MNKKMLSVLLAVSMVFSTTAIAFADEVVTIEADDAYVTTINEVNEQSPNLKTTEDNGNLLLTEIFI